VERIRRKLEVFGEAQSYSKEFKKQSCRFNSNIARTNPFVLSNTLIFMENTLLSLGCLNMRKFGDQAFPGKGSSEFYSQNKIKNLEKKTGLLREARTF